jgi:hypothetical protein
MFFHGLLGAVAAQDAGPAPPLIWISPDSIGITDPIQTWTDLTTPQYDPTQAVVADRPALITDIDGNGHDGARFDATDVLNALLSLPLPWTMAIAVKVPAKPGSKAYLLGKAGTGGIYITSSGYVGNDLGGTGVEGSTDVTTGYDPGDFDFSTLTLPNTIVDNSANKPDEALIGAPPGADGTEYTIPSGSGGVRRVWYNFLGGIDALIDYGSKDFEVGITITTRDIALNGTNGGVDIYLLVQTSDSRYIRILHRHRTSAAEPSPKHGIKVGTDAGQVGVIATGAVDETNSLWVIKREGDNLNAYYNGVLEGTRAVGSTTTFRQVYLLADNSPGNTRPETWYFSAKDFYAKDDAGQPLEVPTGISSFITVQATADVGASALYVNGVQKAAGSLGSGTLPSIDVIEAALAADVTEAKIYGYVQDSEALAQDASDMSIYQS